MRKEWVERGKKTKSDFVKCVRICLIIPQVTIKCRICATAPSICMQDGCGGDEDSRVDYWNLAGKWWYVGGWLLFLLFIYMENALLFVWRSFEFYHPNFILMQMDGEFGKALRIMCMGWRM